MNIDIEKSLDEARSSGKGIFREYFDGVWLPYLLLLVICIVALVSESSFRRDGANLDIKLGGPISNVSLVGTVVLVVYRLWLHGKSRIQFLALLSGSETMFCAMDDLGILYGLKDVWSRFVSWSVMSEIRFGSKAVYFEVHTMAIRLPLSTLTSAQVHELHAFLRENM